MLKGMVVCRGGCINVLCEEQDCHEIGEACLYGFLNFRIFVGSPDLCLFIWPNSMRCRDQTNSYGGKRKHYHKEGEGQQS